MALTQVRKEQIRDGAIDNSKVNNNAGIQYSKLDLSGSIISTDLNSDNSVHHAVLDSKLVALWDYVGTVSSGTSSSLVVTTEITSTAATTTATSTGSLKGVLTTGTGTNGAGTENYKVQIRNSATGDPISDGLTEGNGGAVYAELRESGGVYTLYFFKSDDTVHTFTASMNIDFMFVEIFSLDTAPVKGFVTGMGFADVVGVAGTHNHDDRYYTQTQLNAGQLDNRYYTEIELDNGQLDNRYYTESELDGGQLDNRYYTESELNNTAGATYIGYSGDATGSTVKAALDWLDGQIDNIVSGSLDITFSMDDTYNDGSVVTVDDTDVDFQVTDAKKFQISDSAGVSIFNVAPTSSGDSINATADLNLTGDLAQSGGTVTLTATGAAAISSDTSAKISETSNAANYVEITSQSTLSSNSDVNLVSTSGNVVFNDSIQTSAINFSQTNADGFATEFGYDQQTDFNWSVRDLGTAAVSSIMGAVNTNRQDLYEYVELLGTQGASVGVAAGANLIGVDGITGITPTGHNLGDDSNLQEMLEGIVASAGGSDKHFATLNDFLTSKSSGDYFSTNTQIWIEDIERQIRVYTQNTNTVEGTDWDYIWGETRPMGGTSGTSKPKFHSIITNVDADAIKLSAVSGGIDIDAGAITIDSTGTISIAANVLILKDQYLSSAIPLSESGVSALSGFDTATSIVGALNENAADIATLITDLADTTDSSSGADMIGVTGITGVKPEGGTVGADGTLQAMLEGLAKSAGGVKTYDSESAFTTDKTNGAYLPADTMVYLKDVDRFAIVLLENTQAVEGTDWDYLWGANQPLAGGDFVVDVTDTSSDAIKLTSAGGIDIDSAEGFALNDDSGARLIITSAGAVTLQSALGKDMMVSGGIGSSYLKAQDESVTVVGSGTSDSAIKLDATNGGIDIDAGADKNVTIDTSGVGQIQLTSADEIDLDTPNVDIHGDVTVATDKFINVDKINITSVDPSDSATISGQRTGTLNSANILTNSGFEDGAGADADDWTEGSSASRTSAYRYYDAYSIHVQATDLASDENILTQAITGATASTAHNVSFYARGSVGGTVSVQLNGGAAVNVDMSALDGTWRRFNVDLGADNAASGNFYITIAGSGTEDYDFYIDAVMVVPGSIQDYFTSSQSELVFTIGDNDDDKIVMRSVGSANKNLMTINQTTVEILGDLLVSGTTTTVNSEDMLVTDNMIVLNSGQSSGVLDAFVEVDRGSDPNVSIKWNESTDEWELTNDGSTFATIVTSGSAGALSLDEAYNGGSTITVDNTDVDWTLSTGKAFKVDDGTDSSKFVISEGSGSDSIKIDTSGGVDVDTDLGIVLTTDRNSASSYIDIGANTAGRISLRAGGSQQVELISPNNLNTLSVNDNRVSVYNQSSSDTDAVRIKAISGGIDIDAALNLDVDASGILLDSDAASNFTVDSADLTLSTTTSGNVAVNAAATVDIDAATSVTIDATNITTTGILTQTGNTQIVGDLDMDGAIDHDGATFDSNVTSTSATAFNITSAGGIKALASGLIDLDGATFTLDITGTDADSIIVNTAGGIDIDTANGLTLDDDTGAYFHLSTVGEVDLLSASNQDASLNAAGTGIATLGSDAGSTKILNASATVDNSILIDSTSGGIDINAASTKPVTIDAGSFSIDSVLDSNVSVTNADLTISTITTGDLILIGAGNITFDDQYLTSAVSLSETGVTGFATGMTATSIIGGINEAYEAATGANTLDEVYSTEDGTGARDIAVDDGDINFNLYSGKSVNFKTDGGADIFDITHQSSGSDTAAMTADLTVTGNYTLTGDLGQSGGAVTLNATGAVDIDSTSSLTADAVSFSVDSTSDSNVSVTGGDLTLSTITSGDVVINSVNAIDMDAASATLDTTGAISLDSAAASNFTVDGATLTLSTTTSGDIALTSVGDVLITASSGEIDLTGSSLDLNATNAFTIDGGAASSIVVTGGDLTIGTSGSSGELKFEDFRASAIPFSDSSNSSFASGMSATSIIGAINEAYQKSIDMSYQEIIADSTDVSNDYIVTTLDLPTTGSFPMSPATLRGQSPVQYHLAVYLNGLRLADTEWNYTYSSTEHRITFDGSDDITLVSGDKIMLELRKSA